MEAPPRDPSNGDDALAEEFARRRHPEIGGLESIWLGREGYREALAAAGLRITAEFDDAGGDHYCSSGRACVAAET